VVRKWSYINFKIKIIKNKPLNKPLSNFKKKLPISFKFKIFRKNTRFKDFNLSYTKFKRKNPASISRRTSYKNYLIVISNWVKPFLKQKQISAFVQTNHVFSLSSPIVSLNAIKPNYVPSTSLGKVYGFNFSILNRSLYKKLSNEINCTKSRTTIQFYSIKSLIYFNNLGLNTFMVNFMKTYFSIHSTSKGLLSPCLLLHNLNRNSFQPICNNNTLIWLNTVLKISLNMRQWVIYSILFLRK